MGKAKTIADNFTSVLVVVLVGCTLLAALGAQAETGKLVVATRDLPPFVIRQADGSLSDIAIDLWRGIALRPGTPLRDDLNRALLRRISQPEWEATLFRYLGD